MQKVAANLLPDVDLLAAIVLFEHSGPNHPQVEYKVLGVSIGLTSNFIYNLQGGFQR